MRPGKKGKYKRRRFIRRPSVAPVKTKDLAEHIVTAQESAQIEVSKRPRQEEMTPPPKKKSKTNAPDTRYPKRIRKPRIDKYVSLTEQNYA